MCENGTSCILKIVVRWSMKKSAVLDEEKCRARRIDHGTFFMSLVEQGLECLFFTIPKVGCQHTNDDHDTADVMIVLKSFVKYPDASYDGDDGH